MHGSKLPLKQQRAETVRLFIQQFSVLHILMERQWGTIPTNSNEVWRTKPNQKWKDINILKKCTLLIYGFILIYKHISVQIRCASWRSFQILLLVLIEDNILMQGATKWKHNIFGLSCLASYFLFCNGNVANRYPAMLMLSGILCCQQRWCKDRIHFGFNSFRASLWCIYSCTIKI